MTSKRHTVALVGARGHVGKEIFSLLSADSRFQVMLATSREHKGKSTYEIFGTGPTDLRFADAGPEDVAGANNDIVVLGLPNGLAAPYVDAIEQISPNTLIIDLSADYRHQPGWSYGIADLLPESVVGKKRIANPGCYATAAILSLYPLADLMVGTPSVFGLSGYSGAGTTPSAKNDVTRLSDNVMPYGFAGHGHQAEISEAIGRNVRFMPHVTQFFRGLLTTSTVELKAGTDLTAVMGRYEKAYADCDTVSVQSDAPEISHVVGTPNAVIGGAQIDAKTGMLAVACAHDNLLKGAASQAMQNIRLALELR